MYSILSLLRRQEKSTFLKIAVQAFQARDFLYIFVRFLGFWDSFSYKTFSWKKRRVWHL